MQLEPTPLDTAQWKKVTRALAYSFISGFVGGLALGLTNFLNNGASFDKKALTALVIASVVAGLNTAAVGVKQIFTEPGK